MTAALLCSLRHAEFDGKPNPYDPNQYQCDCGDNIGFGPPTLLPSRNHFSLMVMVFCAFGLHLGWPASFFILGFTGNGKGGGAGDR